MKGQAEVRTLFGDFCRYFSFYFKAFKYLLTIVFQPGSSTSLLDPQQVLRSKLGVDLVVLDLMIDDTPVAKLGDNFGSNVVKVNAHVKRADSLDKLHLIAKMLPSSDFQRMLYKCDVSVAKEIFFYEQIIPAYRNLYAGEFDIVPEFYGGRLRLGVVGAGVEPVEIVDDSAVILLENLNVSGYAMVDRCEGLNMDHMSIAIPAIAKFHAIGLAMKHRNPEFLATMQKYAEPIDVPEEMSATPISVILKSINYNPQLRRYFDRVRALSKNTGGETNSLLQTTLKPDNPWACLVHRDLWNNNVMFHTTDGKVDNFKVFDFQNYCFSSPTTDLLFFLLTSTQRDFANLDQLVELYRITAHNVLRELGCDASLFERDSFHGKMKEDAPSELFHSILMARTSEMRSMWDIVRPGGNEHFVKRVQGIFEIYDAKQWF